MKKVIINKNTLTDLYCKKKLGCKRIAKILKCCEITILNRLKKYKIRTRKLKVVNISKNKLIGLYVNKKLGCTKLSKIFKCSEHTIISKLKKYKIKIRGPKVVTISQNKLYDLYINKKLNIPEIRKTFNCSSFAVFYKLKQYKIKIRTIPRIGKTARNWKGGLPKCVDCGKPLSDYVSKRCIECYYKHAKGKNANNWSGGITSVRDLIRHSLEYKQWRNEVFKRDKFTCVECSQVGGFLQAHHIKHFVELLQEAKEMLPSLSLYDTIMLYKPIWDVNNGITYCKKCHKEFHKQYNRVNEEQTIRLQENKEVK